MKTILKSIMMATLCVGLVSTGMGQITSESPASATILADLTIDLEAGTEIDFGNLSASTPGAVVLDANGTANANTGSVTNVARFNLAGADSEVTVNYDEEVILTETLVGTATMTVTPEVVGDALTANQAAAVAVPTGSTVTLADGEFYLWVGGTIPQLTSQANGIYEGTFNISVEYN